MATNLSATALSVFMQNMRSQAGAISVQESQLIDPQLIDIAHNAVTFVRNVVGKFVDDLYKTKVTLSVTISSNLGTCDLTSYCTAAVGTIADPSRMSLFDPVLKEVAIMTSERFNGFRTVYSSGVLTITGAIATVVQVSAKTSLMIYTGAANGSLSPDLFYYRNPIKVIAAADTIDLPDHLVPMAQDVGTMYIFRKLAKAPPADFENRVVGSLQAYASQYGLKIQPDTPR